MTDSGFKILDFDTADAFLDICVFAYGTDVSVSVYVFRYDGGKVIHYHTFNVGDDTSFTYDSKGMVYYNTFLDEPGSFRYVHASYDCRRNDVSYIDID